MFEPISAGICIWLFVRWLRRKMDEEPTADHTNVAALCQRHGISHTDVHGITHRYDQEYERPKGPGALNIYQSKEIHNHLHVHYHCSDQEAN